MQHSQERDLIWQELHARPYVRFSGPAHVLRISFLLAEGEDVDPRTLRELTHALRLAPTYETPRHSIFATTIPGTGRLVLSCERHSDFVAYTFFLYDLEIPFRPFGFDVLTLVPQGWLAGFATPPLVATRIAVGATPVMPDTLEGLVHTIRGPHDQREPGHGGAGGSLDLLSRVRGRFRQNRDRDSRRVGAGTGPEPWSGFSRSKMLTT